MSIQRTVILYGLTFFVFLAVDLLWLGVLARSFYARELGPLMRPDVRWGAAFLFYAIYVGGILALAVMPALDRESLARAIVLGATLGLVAYAAYDLTNLATLAGFPARMVAVDLAWGMVLTGTVAAAGFGIARWLGG